MNQLDVKRVIGMCILAVAAIFTLVLSGQIVENLDAHQIMVIQAPVSGKLTWHISAGYKWQGFGTVTKYPKRSMYNFEFPVRFNDGGHGTMHGSIQYEMPLDVENLTKLHVRFGNPEAIQKQLVETITNKAVYMTGPLMSSKESYAEKRNYLISYVEDQIVNGVYKTISKEVRVKDPMTGADKTVTVVEIVTKDGQPERQEEAVLRSFGIKPFNFAIEKLPYDETVENQIKQQQAIAMDVQTAIADAKKAEQRAITVAEQGKADAAKAKWDQEVIKARFVTEAEQKLEIAKLGALAAEQNKRASILEGEGEATKRQLIMNADGALEKKLAAYIEVNKLYADAIKGYQGNWVPSVVMGGTSGSNSQAGSGAMTFMEILAAKAARDLGVDVAAGGASRTKSKQ